MFQNLLKAIPINQSNGTRAAPLSSGWDDPPPAKPAERGQGVGRPAWLGVGEEGSGEEEEAGVAIEMHVSEEVSERESEVISVNEYGEEEQHPMIISNIRVNRPLGYYRHTIFRIRDGAAALRLANQDLLRLLAEHKTQYRTLLQNFTALAARLKPEAAERESLEREARTKAAECAKLSRELAECKAQLESSRTASRASSKRIEEEKPCGRCRVLEGQLGRAHEELRQNEQQLDKVLIENEQLQEYIFDMEQKVVGIDLEVEKRLKDKSRIDLPPISPIREDRELIEQLENELAALQQAHLALQDQFQQHQQALLERDRREGSIKQALAKLEAAKEENYEREHELTVAEENLSKKISELRRKEAELSEWEAQLAQQGAKARPRDNTLANQFPSNDPSFQQSAEDHLNRSRDSLNSFGRAHPHEDSASPPPPEKSDPRYYRLQTPDDQPRPRQQHEFVRERVGHVRTEGRFGESAYVGRREQQVSDLIAKKYNPQLSNYQNSREASPYRALHEPPARPYLPKPTTNTTKHSPAHYRDVSKNSKASLSKPKPTPSYSQHAAQSRGVPRSNQLGGLGSKLERLREEIKKEIDSIK